MKTTQDFEDIIYARLDGSGTIRPIISGGGIYKTIRPDGSKSVDVVIKSLVADNQQLQRGVVNVNVHVPNLKITIAGQPQSYQPDHETLGAVTKEIIELVDDFWTDDFSFEVAQQTTFEERDIQEHFSNIRINVYSINL